MRPRKAVHIGIIIDRRCGQVCRIINPTFERELDLHHVAEHETMLRVNKRAAGIARRGDGMAPADAARLIDKYSGRR